MNIVERYGLYSVLRHPGEDFAANIDSVIEQTTGGTVAAGSDADNTDELDTDNTQGGQTDNGEGDNSEGDQQAQQAASQNRPAVKPRVRRPAGKQAATDQQTQQQTQNRDPNDLYGPNGQLIAKAGRERRYYDSWNRAEQQHAAAKQQLSTLQNELNTFKQASSMGNQLNLTPNEQVIGMQLVAAWKQDPAKAIRAILTQAKQQGINVDLEGMTSGIDADAIVNRIRQEFAPILHRTQAEAEAERVATEAQQQYDAFIRQYPDAQNQQREIAAVMQAQGLSPREAYHAVRAWAAENGYDWTKPLGPQHQARRAQGANNGQGRNTQQTVPLNGRGVGGSVNNGVRNVRPKAAVNDSWDSIVDGVAHEFGIQR